MLNLWSLGGLSLKDLIRRTAYHSWQDAVFGQGGRMAFYHFLAIFPSLLVIVALARDLHFGDAMRDSLGDLVTLLLPAEASQLIQQTVNETTGRTLSGLQLFSISAGALWAALNGTWALMYGLNRAYELEEHRSSATLALTIAGLTGTVAGTTCASAFVMFCGTRLQPHSPSLALAFRAFLWVVLSALLLLSFAVVYRFAPNLRNHEWRWSTPGAVCALILWLGSTWGARFYFDHINNYGRSYGHLNGVIMLLLWLYVTNGAILIGGEMNSEIEKAAVKTSAAAAREQDRSGS